jgi:hypothetical protein
VSEREKERQRREEVRVVSEQKQTKSTESERDGVGNNTGIVYLFFNIMRRSRLKNVEYTAHV